MNNRTLFFALSLIGLAAGAPLLSGCHLFGSDAAEAYSQYQAAVAAGDLTRARIALTRLVGAKEDVADYWIELGKVQLQLGDYPKAYEAFSRAHELDRSNVEIMAALTRLALLSGQIPVADEEARSLALLDPENPAVSLVKGYVALTSGNLDTADAEADKLLAGAPDDSNSTILKARILIARDRTQDAIALLEKQHQAIPDDRSAMRALASLYRSRDDWRNMARVETYLHRLDQNNALVSQTLVEASLRSGNVAAARAVSAFLLARATTPEMIESTLDLWSRYAPRGSVLPDALKFANAATGDKRAIFAQYFNRIGRPTIAARLLGGPQLPVTASNSRWNAMIAQSMALQGQAPQAKQLFDMVLEREPDQVDALRGRSALEARIGMTNQAIVDAQRLVSATPKTGEDRLLLAQAFLAAGKRNEVRRTLWQAFQDLPDDERVVSALKSVLVSTGDADGQSRLADEFADRRKNKLTKELV